MKLILLGLLFSTNLFADDKIIELRIKDHKFNIEKLEVKANEKFKIKVFNDDASSEEFESKTMIVEKFIGPKKSLVITLGPLKPGTYEYFGDFHQSTAKGVLTAK
jgi:DNA polymerase III delta subunit